MLIGTEALTVADDAFAPWQMHSAMGATHHILAARILWRVFPLDPAAIAFDESVYNPGSQGKKYQFDQHYPASGNEAPQLSRLEMNYSGREDSNLWSVHPNRYRACQPFLFHGILRNDW